MTRVRDAYQRGPKSRSVFSAGVMPALRKRLTALGLRSSVGTEFEDGEQGEAESVMDFIMGEIQDSVKRPRPGSSRYVIVSEVKDCSTSNPLVRDISSPHDPQNIGVWEARTNGSCFQHRTLEWEATQYQDFRPYNGQRTRELEIGHKGVEFSALYDKAFTWRECSQGKFKDTMPKFNESNPKSVSYCTPGGDRLDSSVRTARISGGSGGERFAAIYGYTEKRTFEAWNYALLTFRFTATDEQEYVPQAVKVSSADGSIHTYWLKAVMLFSGNMLSGHYYALIRVGGPPSRWVEFNDAFVQDVPVDKVYEFLNNNKKKMAFYTFENGTDDAMNFERLYQSKYAQDSAKQADSARIEEIDKAVGELLKEKEELLAKQEERGIEIAAQTHKVRRERQRSGRRGRRSAGAPKGL